MSEAELKELRKETKKFIDHADERVLRMVYAMLEADASSDAEESTFEKEMNKRFTEMVNESVVTYTIDESIARAKKAQKALKRQ